MPPHNVGEPMAKSRRTPKKKTSVAFTARQEAYLIDRAERDETTFAETVRRIIDDRIAREKWRGPDDGPGG